MEIVQCEEIYDSSLKTLLEKNGITDFVENHQELLNFLQKQRSIIKLFFQEQTPWKAIEEFYKEHGFHFALSLRFIKLFRQNYLKHYPQDKDFFERMEQFLEYMAKGYIRKSVSLLKEYTQKSVLQNLLLYTTKKRWIERIIYALEKDDFSNFPVSNASSCPFKTYLSYPQSLLICTEAASCAHLDELHTTLHKFAAEFYYLYTHKKYSQAYLIFRDLIDTFLQFSNLITELYFLTYTDIEASFFSLVEHYAQSEYNTFVVLIDYQNLKRLNTIYGETNVTQGMQQIEAELDHLMQEEPENYLYIKGTTANYYLLAIDKDEEDLRKLLERFRNITTSTQEVEEQNIEFTSFIGALKLSNSTPLSREDITKMLLQLRQEAKEKKSGIKTALSQEEFKQIYDWLLKKYKDTKYLEQKLAAKEFDVVFQPISTDGKKIYALESLIRIKEKDRLIPAFVFIDLFIELDLIAKLDLITLELLESKLEKIKIVTSRLFVNTSFHALQNRAYIDALKRLIHRAKEEGVEVIIELTEQQLVEHTQTIKELKKQDFLFAVDDFGSGYTSIKTVADLAFEGIIAFLKIDGSLIKELAIKEELRQIVKAIGDIGRAFNLYTIAEFVEDQTSINYLKQHRIDLLQGYYIARPQTIEALIAKKMKEEL